MFSTFPIYLIFCPLPPINLIESLERSSIFFILGMAPDRSEWFRFNERENVTF